jgi:zinc protease
MRILSVSLTAPVLAALLSSTLASSLASSALAAPVQTDWKKIKAPPLRAFKPQQPSRIQLDNGLVIFLQPDTELPLIEVGVAVRGGSREEPADKVGLVNLFSQVLRTGGTKTRTGDQIDDFLAARGAEIELSADADSVDLQASFLKTDFDDVVKLILEMLREPEFRDDKLDLAKRQLYTGIKRRNDNPMSIAMRESAKLAFGPAHPYARHAEFATVAAVSRDDLKRWHGQRVMPNNMMIGVAGDFEPAQMEAKLRALFSGWQKGSAPPVAKIDFQPSRPGVFFVPKNDVNQSNIQLVQLGVTRKNPDHYAIKVMNEILGGGFSARLFTNVRSKKGLAYSVRGSVGMGWEHPDVYRLWMGTKSENTVKAVKALREEIDGMLKNPPNAGELERAKESILNSFVFMFDSKMKIMLERARLEFYGYPPDYWEKYPTEIGKVTLDDVKRVAQKYLNPGGFALLVVGKSAEFDSPLETLGAVSNIDVTIPPPPPGVLSPKPPTTPAPAPGQTPAKPAAPPTQAPR